MNFEGADLTRPQEAAVLALIFPTSSTSLVLYKKSTSGYLGICKLWAVLWNRTKNENTIFQCVLYLSSSKAIMISLFKFNFRFFFKTKNINETRCDKVIGNVDFDVLGVPKFVNPKQSQIHIFVLENSIFYEILFIEWVSGLNNSLNTFVSLTGCWKALVQFILWRMKGFIGFF